MKLIDISQTLNESSPVYPGDCKFTLSKEKTLSADNYNAHTIRSGLHTGTHIDTPMHLTKDKKTAADFDPIQFIGEGVLFDVRGEDPIQMRPEYETMCLKNKIALLYTSHDENYFKESYYTDYPVISDKLADFFISEKVKMIGMDTPSPDHFPFNIHKRWLSNQIFILENLTNLKELKEINEFEVIAFPLKICAEASFVRAVCRAE